MEQVFWILVIVFLGALPTTRSCPYNVTVCPCAGDSVVCQNLAGVPPLISNNENGSITKLTFMFGILNNISDNSLPANLQILTFSNVSIASISPDAFSKSASTLKSFTMRSVNYPEVPKALLKVNGLTELIMSDVNVAVWNTTVLLHLGKTVLSVTFDNVSLTSWPNWFQNFTSVNSAVISRASFFVIPTSAFKRSGSLTSLTLTKINKTTRAELTTDSWYGLISLTETLEILDITNNTLHFIPTPVVNMSKLMILNASNNEMVSIRSYRIPLQLKVLDLSHNLFLTINDESFPNGSALEVLNLSYNLFSVITDMALNPLQQLRELIIEHTRLTRIPLALSKLDNLKIVKLDDTDTLRCDPPLENELALWYERRENLTATGVCVFSEYDPACFLSNILDTSQCSGSGRLGYNTFVYLSVVILAYVFPLCQSLQEVFPPSCASMFWRNI